MSSFLLRGRLIDLWERLQNSYWFVPSAMVLAAMLLAIGMVRLDYLLAAKEITPSLWFAALQADAARTILSTLAGSMATVAGVVFSITVVALQLASTQFGPRVLRGFLADAGNQIALGTFVASFAYCLLVIATVRDQSGFVPRVATGVGLLIGITAIGVLVFFIHHVANFIRADSVIAALTADLHRTTDTLFPQEMGCGDTVERQESSGDPDEGERMSRPVRLRDSGYIRRIDDAALMALARDADLVVRLMRRPGDFVVAGNTLLSAAPRERIDDEAAERLRGIAVLGHRRTPAQDIEFALDQLVEVALRALSPGINDPFTAISSIDRLGEGLCRIAGRRMPALRRRDDHGCTRVIVTRGHSLAALARRALGPIASSARSQAAVTVRLIEVILLVASRARSSADRGDLLTLAASVVHDSEAALESERERAQVQAAFMKAREPTDGARFASST